MSLYRKYRPQSFSDLLGQDHIREVLQNALRQEKVSHAYLFTGPRGTGKTSTARLLAHAINCPKLADAEPCNSCELCLEISSGSLTDIIEIDAASHGLVDDARDLVEKAKFLPTRAQKKVYIIDEVHMLSKSAFNALLKTIEEPPDHVHFILATTESHKVPETILSRCQRFDFHLADIPLIEQCLTSVCTAEGAEFDKASLTLLAEHARGSFRDAISLLEQVIGEDVITLERVQTILGLSESSAVNDFIDALLASDQPAALAIISAIAKEGRDLFQFTQMVLAQLRKELVSERQAQVLPWVDVFFVALDQLRDPLLSQLPLELAVAKCCGPSMNLPSAAVEQNSVHPTSPEKKSNDVAVEAVQEVKPEKKKPKKVPKPFDEKLFLGSLQHASLRTLVKFSELEFKDDELTIFARSSFEQEKMIADENLSVLTMALRDLVGSPATVSIEVRVPSGAPSAGVKSDDLAAVFSS